MAPSGFLSSCGFWISSFVVFGPAERDKEQAHAFGLRIGLILEKSEKERASLGRWRRIAPVKVPQERLAVRAGLRVLFRTPERPERRIVALDALVVWKNRLERRENLQAAVAVEI